MLYREETEMNLSVNYVWMCLDVNVVLSHQHAPLHETDCFEMGLSLFSLCLCQVICTLCIFSFTEILFLERFFFFKCLIFYSY